MMAFEIRKIEKPYNIYLILSNSYNSPIEHLEQIETNLRNSYSGRVIFDLLLSNGNSSNRFIEAKFDGEKFDYTSFRILPEVDREIKEVSASYYRNNENFLQSSIVSNAFKFLLRKGKVL
jgi:hypothetical protein